MFYCRSSSSTMGEDLLSLRFDSVNVSPVTDDKLSVGHSDPVVMSANDPNHPRIGHLTYTHIHTYEKKLYQSHRRQKHWHVCGCFFYVCTSWHPLLSAGSAEYPRIPQVWRHGVAAPDRSSLHWNNSAPHELRPSHAVTVQPLRWVNWEGRHNKLHDTLVLNAAGSRSDREDSGVPGGGR